MPQITVQANQKVNTKQVGVSYIGSPIEEIQLTRHVGYGDLDLSSPEGRAALDKRIKETAKKACEQLNTHCIRWNNGSLTTTKRASTALLTPPSRRQKQSSLPLRGNRRRDLAVHGCSEGNKERSVEMRARRCPAGQIYSGQYLQITKDTTSTACAPLGGRVGWMGRSRRLGLGVLGSGSVAGLRHALFRARGGESRAAERRSYAMPVSAR